MPAYVQHHEVEAAAILCPNCIGLAMYVSDIEPHWSMAKIDFILRVLGVRHRNQENCDQTRPAALAAHGRCKACGLKRSRANRRVVICGHVDNRHGNPGDVETMP